MGRDSLAKRCYFLTFGVPPPGLQGGNTPANTLKVLKIIHGATKQVKYHSDGGWQQALRVSIL